MPDFSKDANKKNKVFDKADKAFEKGMLSVEQLILKALQDMLSKFDTKNGKITNNPSNLNRLAFLEKKIRKAFKDARMDKLSKKYLSNFDTIDKLNKSFYKNILDPKELGKISDTFRKTNVLKSQLIDDLTTGITNYDSFKNPVIKPIRDKLFQSVIFEHSYDEANKALRDELISTGKANSKLLRYSKQISRDALSQYDGAINDAVRDDFNLNAFTYANALKATSRATCIGLVNSTGKYADLAIRPGDYWVKDIPKIISRSQGSGGWNPATTPSTFGLYRGGYNCNHRVLYYREKKATQSE